MQRLLWLAPAAPVVSTPAHLQHFSHGCSGVCLPENLRRRTLPTYFLHGRPRLSSSHLFIIRSEEIKSKHPFRIRKKKKENTQMRSPITPCINCHVEQRDVYIQEHPGGCLGLKGERILAAVQS